MVSYLVSSCLGSCMARANNLEAVAVPSTLSSIAFSPFLNVVTSEASRTEASFGGGRHYERDPLGRTTPERPTDTGERLRGKGSGKDTPLQRVADDGVPVYMCVTAGCHQRITNGQNPISLVECPKCSQRIFCKLGNPSVETVYSTE